MSELSPLKTYRSPHFDPRPIPVEFLILHYTAQSLKGSLNIFVSQKKAVSCHLLIDEKGRLFELVSCWEGLCRKAFHAGKSRRFDPKLPPRLHKSFNDFSIGVELVNLNGNFYPYSPAQYQSLFYVVSRLKTVYPKLTDPHRILGHEHIAGFRGKADPGFLFQWQKFFKRVYPAKKPFPQRRAALSKNQVEILAPLFRRPLNDQTAKRAGLILETADPFDIKRLRLKRLLNKKPAAGSKPLQCQAPGTVI